jgi:hypothetical protein
MPDFLNPVRNYIFDFILREYSLAYLGINNEGNIVSLGGNLSKYSLEDLEIGQKAEEQIIFLQGLLPFTDQLLVLQKVYIKLDISADIHLLSDEGTTWALLFDSSLEVQLQQKWQQKYNELNLLHEKYNKLIDK